MLLKTTSMYILFFLKKGLTMNIKSFFQSFYIKNYYTLSMLISTIFITLGLFIPKTVSDFQNNELFFKLTEYFFIIIFSIIFIFSLFMYIKSFFIHLFVVRNSKNTAKFQKILFFAIVFFKLYLYANIFQLNKNDGQIYSDDYLYSCIYFVHTLYIASLLLFISFYIYDFTIFSKKELDSCHWIDKYLAYNQIRIKKNVKIDGKIVSIHFNGFSLNELSNTLTFMNNDLKISSFREYMDENKYKLNDLTYEEVLIIKMIGI